MSIKHKGWIVIFVASILYSSCTKDKTPVVATAVEVNDCVKATDTVSYNQTIRPILLNNCMPCHEYPGSGGISLNLYSPTQALAISGQLLHSVQGDTNYVIMPPPPKPQLDSCQINALSIWISQGCIEN